MVPEKAFQKGLLRSWVQGPGLHRREKVAGEGPSAKAQKRVCTGFPVGTGRECAQS